MRGIVRSLIVSAWFMFLTFPFLALKVNSRTLEITWRLENVAFLGIGIFFASFLWRFSMVKKGLISKEDANMARFISWIDVRRNSNLFFGSCFAILSLIPISYWLAYSFYSNSWVIDSTFFISTFTLLLGLFIALVLLKDKKDIATKALSDAYLKISVPGKRRSFLLLAIFTLLLSVPFTTNSYQIGVFTQTMIWIILGLGLNIIVGESGLLVLGYVAFYAIGAYTYAVCNYYFSAHIGFWTLLPAGAIIASLAGIFLSLPVLRLRGDYLAIVTLGFGEIIRTLIIGGSLSFATLISLLPDGVVKYLPNWMHESINLGGPAGFASLPAPDFFDAVFNRDMATKYIYFITLILTVFTIFAISRLRDSRIGRSWMALRDDEIACEAMGINKSYAKLTAFAMGTCWAGFGGVLFAANTSFINPNSFTFMESALILSVVVLGGLGSVLGVIVGACILILLPEYLRFVNEYRMLIFGASMVLMMIFRPQGLIKPSKKQRFPANAFRE